MVRRARRVTAGAPSSDADPDGIPAGASYGWFEVVSMEPPASVRWPGPARVHALRAVASTWVVAGPAGRKRDLLPAGVWLASDPPASASGPIPCRCKGVDHPDDRCRDLTNHDFIAARGWRPCDCWGRPVHAQTPPGCCRRHPKSVELAEWRPGDPPLGEPRPAIVEDEVPSDVEPELYLRREAEDGALVEVEAAFTRLDRLAIAADLEEEEAEQRWRVEVAAAKARLSHDRCDCPDRWPGQKGTGYHCPSCHEDFASYGLATLHARSWLVECRPPATVLDVDTGHQLLTRRKGVWYRAELTSPGRPGFKYE